MTVSLPIVALPVGSWNFWLGLGALLSGVSFLLPAAMIAGFFVDAGSGADHFSLSLRGGFIFLILLLLTFPILLFYGIGFTGAALTCFWDAARSDPVLEIAADGLRDRRSGLSVPWSTVKSAKPLPHLGVDLQLGGPVPNWQNPFRVGILFQRRRPPDHVIVSLAYLDTSVHVLTPS